MTDTNDRAKGGRDALTAERLRELFVYDPLTGVFTNRVNRRCARAGNVAGGLNTTSGYRIISIGRHRYSEHRLAWLYMTGAWPKQLVDHIDGNPLNNTFANLRDSSPSVNSQNRKLSARSKSGLLGVKHHAGFRNPWEAVIRAPLGKQISLGYFSTPEAAHEVYLQAKRNLHEGFAR